MDSDALIRAARAPKDWVRVSAYLRRRFSLHPCPMPMFELLGGLEGGADEHWMTNMKPLQILDEATGPFLPMPGRLVLAKLLGITKPYPGYEPAQLNRVLRLVVRSKRRAELRKVKLSTLSTHMRELKANHVEVLNEARKGMVSSTGEYDLSHEAWARVLLGALGVEATGEHVQQVMAGTDAAYRAGRYLWMRADDDSAVAYNFDKHSNDVIDEQQLYYLCDASMHLLTADGGIRTKIMGSPQASRVLLWEDVVRAA
jgi:hypothetical protein